ncbi:MAG: hypothetical protein EBX36_01390 [Planctomycetia bacterium]|nr:hypothetical protein [Planctomycetia bacterium]
MRDECLNQHWFPLLDEARAVTEAWWEDCARVRPHGGLADRRRRRSRGRQSPASGRRESRRSLRQSDLRPASPPRQ